MTSRGSSSGGPRCWDPRAIISPAVPAAGSVDFLAESDDGIFTTTPCLFYLIYTPNITG